MAHYGGENHIRNITPQLIEKYKDKITNAPIVHYTDVMLNINEVVLLVKSILIRV